MRSSRLVPVVILVLSALAYLPSVGGDFVWDDRPLILGDTQIQSFEALPQLFARDFFAPGEVRGKYGYYRPAVSLSYMIDWALWKDNALGYRLTNLFWHLVCTLLVWLLARRLIAKPPWAADVAAALFGLHPIHTESVAWIAGRTDVLCTAAALGALLAWEAYLRRNDARLGFVSAKKKTDATPPARAGWGLLTAALALFAASLFAKEMGVVVLPAALALAYFHRPERAALRRLTPEGALLVAVLVAYLALRIGVAGVLADTPPPEHAWWKAALTFPAALAIYATKLLAPVQLSAYYVQPYATHPFSLAGLAGLALLAGAGFVLVRLCKRDAALALLVLLLLLSLGPLTNLVRISAPRDMGFPMAERFLYLPSAFACLLVALAIGRINVGGKRGATMIAAVAVLVALALGVRTVSASQLWRDEKLVFEHALEVNDQAPLMWIALGAAYRRDGRVDEALQALRKAETLNETLKSADPVALYNNLGTALATAGRLGEALEAFDRALERGRETDRVQFNRAEALRLLGRPDEALTAYDAALRVTPTYIQARWRRGSLLAELRRIDEAQADLQDVLRRVPDHPEANALLRELAQAPVEQPADAKLREANELFRADKVDDAEIALKQVLELRPGDPEALIGLAHVARRRNQIEQAVTLLRQALLAQGDNPHTYATLGGLQGRLKDYAAAAVSYRRAVELAPDDPGLVAGLASALFRTNDRAGAKAALDAAAKRFPDEPAIVLALLNYYFESGDLATAKKLLPRAVELAPTHPQVRQFQKVLADKP